MTDIPEIKSHKVMIKGAQWSVRRLSNTKYKKLHGAESCGVTIEDKKIIDLNNKHFGKHVIIHEIFHAFMKECHTSSADLTAEQLEEVAAVMLEFNLETLSSLSNEVYEVLK